MTSGPEVFSEDADDIRSDNEGSLSVDHRELRATFVIKTDGFCPALDVRGGKAGEIIRMKSVEEQKCVFEIAREDLDDACDSVKEMSGSCDCSQERREDLPNEAILRITNDRSDNCICDVFQRYGLYPNIRTNANNSLQMEVTLLDREPLPSLVEDLKTVAESVRLVDLTSATPNHSEEVSLDLSVLTDSQRDFFRRSVEEGLFEDPRQITVRELAEKLDISASAASRRLRRIQMKLFSQFEL
ncbi:helix-turn-helix domain-containing protein [Halodesulfurarchaeum sp.]|uniref:helix-turn-helix domain-containing protein n=1 Tax=Halodesulfurarchaeum sp. TaxID=1980530 RepID=UPI001BBE5091|nr:helix-turn-helix domain-containing protein [Halodesulfurarchaeum sp.]